jgi:hypothetical protein
MLPYITYFEKMKVGLCDHVTFVYLYVCPTCQFRKPEPIFMKFGMYIMAPVSISTAYFINSSHQSMSICIPQFLIGNGSVDTFLQQ